jgi:hypothetical protein
LVLFDRQEVLASLVIEDLFGLRHLGVGRVGQHDLVHQIQLGQLLAARGDFVAARRHQRGTQPATAAADRADRRHVGVADFLAVNNHQTVLDRPQHLLLPEQ